MNERIKHLRKSLSLNQTEFGARLSIAQTTVAGYENGSRSPSDAIIYSICREFNVSEAWLRDGEGEMFVTPSCETAYSALIKEVCFMNERIKELRKALSLTQVEFGGRIGVKGNTITNYETGLRSPSDAIIYSICREFNVSEAWLRDGEGEMFVTRSRNQEIAMLVHSILSDEDESFRKRLIHSLCALSIEEWKVLEKIAKGLLPSD